MQTKTYWGDTLSQAIEKAREEWGKGIILLESQKMASSELNTSSTYKITVGVDELTQRMRTWRPPTIASKSQQRIVKQDGSGGFKQIFKEPTPDVKSNAFEKRLVDEIAALRAEMLEMRERTGKLVATNEHLSTIHQEKDSDVLSNAIEQVVSSVSDWKDRETAVMEELNALRRQIKQLKQQNTSDASAITEPFAFTLERISNSGIDSDLAERVVRLAMLKIENHATVKNAEIQDVVMSSLAKLVRTYTFPQGLSDKQQTIFLVGPTGSGKSSMAFKAAIHWKNEANRDACVILVGRSKLPEELSLLAEQSGIEIQQVRTIAEFDLAREKFRNKSLVFIDMPGRSPFAFGSLNEMEIYIKRVPSSEVFLVLSATSDRRDTLLACGLYLLVDPTGLILTKFDETTRPGKIFSILNEVNLPLVSFSDSDKMNVDIIPANVDYLFDRIFNSH